MRRLLVLGLMAALIFSGMWLLACGGGEKQAGEESASQETMLAEKESEDESGQVSEAGWKDIPIYSGAQRFENEMTKRMSAAMTAQGQTGSSRVQFYKSGDDFNKIVSYYKAQMPRKGWEKVTEAAIRALAARPGPLVAVLWGRDAQTLRPLLSDIPAVASAHPSPMSADRGFFGSRPFSRANALLVDQGGTPVDWRLTD